MLFGMILSSKRGVLMKIYIRIRKKNRNKITKHKQQEGSSKGLSDLSAPVQNYCGLVKYKLNLENNM